MHLNYEENIRIMRSLAFFRLEEIKVSTNRLDSLLGDVLVIEMFAIYGSFIDGIFLSIR
jgi:hypothetical protein